MNPTPPGGSSNNYSSVSTSEPETETSKETSIGIGQVLHIDYFDVVIKEATINESVNTGNQ